jgi:hypothetical protein
LTHTQKVAGKADWTVEWWELRDANNRVIHRESYPVGFQNGMLDYTMEVSASSFTTKQGGGILVQGEELPSAPGTGTWVQVFGFKYGRDKYGADLSLFGPFGPAISVYGEFLEVGTDTFRPSPAFGGAAAAVTRDVLKFRVWTGNVNIIYPVQIDWMNGRLAPAWRCFESTSKGQVERCSYPIKADARREDQPTFVRLFSEPDEGVIPKHVVVQPESKVDYLEARTPVLWKQDLKSISFSVDGDLWIKVRIDGVEGWIHSEEDFEAVGLPEAG